MSIATSEESPASEEAKRVPLRGGRGSHVQVNDIWMDCDPRRDRKIKVMAIEDGKAVVKSASGEGPTSKISLERLKPLSSRRGYRLIERDGEKVDLAEGVDTDAADDEGNEVASGAEFDASDEGGENEAEEGDEESDEESEKNDVAELEAATSNEEFEVDIVETVVEEVEVAGEEEEIAASAEVADEDTEVSPRTPRKKGKAGKRVKAKSKPASKTKGSREQEKKPRKIRKMSGALNPNELALYRVMSQDKDRSLEELASAARFPRKVKEKANSWTRNSMRKLINLKVAKRTSRGHYRLTGKKPLGLDE